MWYAAKYDEEKNKFVETGKWILFRPGGIWVISLIMYDEFGKGMGLPSMKESFEDEPYPGKDQVLQYLKQGQKTYVKVTIPSDVYTGEQIDMENCGMNDGVYSWLSVLIYYVEKYNLKLNEEFMQHVFKQTNNS